ncbi:hypothetical protein M427DRAFT_396013 [Gonapodya prolifera JEL478]|uniref:Uncharacterized protein n=1 Tax=Gonapodya prolifera (strain JEL478) TaxID=1344416 RepID=A0A139A6X1_GONPJ|nr:hypothetical protein M427DRAFT_396013 [Gonapodya prolifera JEL478]|eukprot:KXS12566.1 hypothetical protein M427DRAFT_396013 [Gonapodya prolifera JEL478]
MLSSLCPNDTVCAPFGSSCVLGLREQWLRQLFGSFRLEGCSRNGKSPRPGTSVPTFNHSSYFRRSASIQSVLPAMTTRGLRWRQMHRSPKSSNANCKPFVLNTRKMHPRFHSRKGTRDERDMANSALECFDGTYGGPPIALPACLLGSVKLRRRP